MTSLVVPHITPPSPSSLLLFPPILPTISTMALFHEPLRFLSSLLTRKNHRDHFAPHPGVPFEGYYTRILTSTGGTIVMILSSVFGAEEKAHLVHFSYHPSPSSSSEPLMMERFPQMTDIPGHLFHGGGVQEFSRVAKGDGVEGTMRVCRDEVRYRLEFPQEQVEVEVDLSSRRTWREGDEISTPEGALAELSSLLPLHWDVFSVCSRATFSLRRGALVETGEGWAHVEKNWGKEFPSGWTWLQGFSHDGRRCFSFAGGKILGLRAFLGGYRSERVCWDWHPLTGAVLLGGFGAMTEEVDSKMGRARFVVPAGWGRKVEVLVQASAEHEGWVGMRCPLREGHGNTFAYETFDGKVTVRALQRGWWWWFGGWKVVEETVFEHAAVEFGGDYSFKVRR
ncbi:hypothetical protein FN846DRAFT_709644 [Sphaerosporella brunnea]|uniref:Tocopherol cyclase-domain-containing protein n=1 Tax=Sphaerosporella brunnea TaxID=1250544 RepID=A0A5J5EX96_9PEZI|nr:hypothetical protein FN846DRAFT_709644 [Sphaerosporella brunnea]